MTPSEIKAYKLFEALEQNPAQTQRALSKQLEISLGMINTFTKHFVSEGFIEIAIAPNNGLRYVLTPEGISEKARLTHQYVSYSMRYYNAKRSKLRSLLCKFSKNKNAAIYLYGISEHSEIAYITIKELMLEFSGVIDNDFAGKYFFGIRVEDSSILKNVREKDIIIITKIDFSKDDYRLFIENNVASNTIVDMRND